MSVKARYKNLCGDVREMLRKIPDNSVQVCVTSPPYFGLRDYGTATWTGGDKNCDHIAARHASKTTTLNGGKGGGKKLESTAFPYKSVCGKCGARRVDKQIGIEETPQQYIDALVEVFTEVRRVLKPTGTLWINIGDSYAGSGQGTTRKMGSTVGAPENGGRRISTFDGIKPKDMLGIPWMLAFALRASGWWLRQEIIWKKDAPLPESVTDRCTKSHEHIFLLSKSPRYYFDAAAIAESIAESTKTSKSGVCAINAGITGKPLHALHGRKHRYAEAGAAGDPKMRTKVGLKEAAGKVYETHNKRDVWTMNSAGVRDEHYAPYPEELPETCIKAGSKPDDIVLDCFVGSGTTGFVALRLGRRFIGIDLNPKFVKLAERRFVRAIPSLAWELY